MTELKGVAQPVDSLQRLSRRYIHVAATLLVAVGLSLLPGQVAHADPSLSEAQKQVDELSTNLDRTNEELNTAKDDLKQSRERQTQIQNDLGSMESKLSDAETRVGDVGAMAYQTGQFGVSETVLTSSGPQALLDRMSYLDVLSSEQRKAVKDMVKARADLEKAKKQIDEETAKQEAKEKELDEKKKQLQTDLTKWRQIKVKLTPTSASTPSSGGPPPQVSGAAGVAVNFAFAQLGEPYVYGAEGPGQWDCSGLTMKAWNAAGVSGIPHSSSKQYRKFPKVSRSQLQPGDLVFFYGDLHHVGIYIGNNTVIHAPTEGQNVKKESISVMPYAGAARPG